MGNLNKFTKKQNSSEILNNWVILDKDKIEYADLNENFNKSQVLNEDYNFFENLYSNESMLILSKDDNFLGEYKEDFKIIKLIQKDLISKIYKAENLKDKRTVSLKVYNKKNLEQGDYDFF